jgi:tRNA U34 2-thiouridine synthase MnmA/TrmU
MNPPKAVGLLSGGLDSALACKILLDQGIDVHVVYIQMPWGCGKPSRAEAIARALGCPFKVIPLENDYLSVLKSPKYGFGSALNPCVDCHIYMVKKAAAYMAEIGASFVFTGEVVGQRPMSQRRRCLTWVEEDAGIPGRLLRPLCAQLLPETIPEKEGIVDRAKLLGLMGRNRRIQMDMAARLGLDGFATPGGGCLLTEKVFGRRIKDVLTRGCSNISEMTILGAGRYFRLSDSVFVMLGRNQSENDYLAEHAMESDLVFRTYDFPSPTAVLRGSALTPEDIAFTAGLVLHFAKLADPSPRMIAYYLKASPADLRQVMAPVLPEESFQSIWM